jgi:hypothetical protein
MFLLAFDWAGNTFKWNSPTIIGLLCGSVGMILVFGLWQWRMGEYAMIPLAILFKGEVLFCCIAALLHMGPLMLLSYSLLLWFQVILGVGSTLSGVYTLPTMICQSLMLLAAGIAGTEEASSPHIILIGSLYLTRASF